LRLKELRQACCARKNWGNIEAARRREEGKPTTEDLRKEIPLVWRKTFENGIPGGKCYSL